MSDTAEYGDYTRGPRIITKQTRRAMREILAEVQSGQFAREWINEYRNGEPTLAKYRDQERGHPIEEVGAQLRSMMTFLDPRSPQS